MYRLHVQLTPQIHEGEMQYYWHVDLHDGNNQITVKHGWSRFIQGAFNDAFKASCDVLGK